PAGDGPPIVNGLTWPSDPRLGGRAFVSLSVRKPDGPELQLWWLEIHHYGRVVERAGRLITPTTGEGTEATTRERFPSISAAPDGGLALAYLAKRQGHGENQLRVGPVAIDAATGVPRVEESDTVAVAEDREPLPPVFSPDGCWVYSIPSAGGTPDRAERHSVADALARLPARSKVSVREPDPLVR